MLDLAEEVDPARDHVRGPDSAPVTLVEYGDYECPYCGQAEIVIRQLLDEFGDELRYVWRHLPLNDVHVNAQMAAEAAEAAHAQGAFWPMHDRLLAAQEDLTPRDLKAHAAALGLDVERFWEELRRREHADRIGEDVASADAAASPARRASSSTACAIAALTTWRRSPLRSAPPARGRRAS